MADRAHQRVRAAQNEDRGGSETGPASETQEGGQSHLTSRHDSRAARADSGKEIQARTTASGIHREHRSRGRAEHETRGEEAEQAARAVLRLSLIHISEPTR